MRLGVYILFAGILASAAGCKSPGGLTLATEADCADTPSAIKVSRLTEFERIEPENEYASIKAFVEIIDCSNETIEAEGRFRFALYEFIPRSAEKKGKMLHRWEDIAVAKTEMKDHRWHRMLGSYVFDLELEKRLNKRADYVLAATFITTRQQRFSDEAVIGYHEYSN